MTLRVALIAAAALLAAPGPAGAAAARVVDGDTLRVGGRSVRIMGLDAPELRGRCAREVALARAAAARLDGLVAGGVTVELRGRDRYGRALALVRDRRGQDVARILIREGLARPYDGSGRRRGWC